MFFYAIVPSWKVIFLFIPIVITAVIASSVVLFVLSMSYKRRDFILVLPYLLSFMIWVTPIFFTANILPQSIKFLIYFNPIAGLVDLWRACLFSSAKFDFSYTAILLFSIPLLAFSFALYCRKEYYIIDNL
jgi:lipopolysaccharide transport system permease protein